MYIAASTMTETQRRAYGVGKDAAMAGMNPEQRDRELNRIVAEGTLPDTREVDRFALMGYASASS